jgi:hypothetical protein
MLALIFTAILGFGVQDVKPMADVVLVVEWAPQGGLIYRCNGLVLDSKRVASGIQGALGHSDAAATKMFVLFEDHLSLDESFEVASLVEGVLD